MATSHASANHSSAAHGLSARIERALRSALDRATGPGCPPLLAAALNAAVFPGGARLRPQLCLLVAAACGNEQPVLAEGAACALELLHCASLVHDDLPAFDNADTRRGRPSVHRAFGEPLAILAGDALIVLSFETMARATTADPARSARLLALLARAAGPMRGIVGGQAWESEARVPIDEYHQAKTGALFEATVMMGAIAGGGFPEEWRPFGNRLGRAYQAADDLRDLVGNPAELGKPTGRDAFLGRPNLGRDLGVGAARARLTDLLEEALSAIPDCRGRAAVAGWFEALAARLDPGVAAAAA